jgi:hypothetical protein
LYIFEGSVTFSYCPHNVTSGKSRALIDTAMRKMATAPATNADKTSLISKRKIL